MKIENGHLIVDGAEILLPEYPVEMTVQVYRTPADYSNGLFVSVHGPGVPEQYPACCPRDIELIATLSLPAAAAAVLVAARAQRLAEARAALDRAQGVLLAATPSLEQHSWPTQLAEARRVQAYAAAPDTLPAEVAPLLSLMAVSRGLGESVVELAGKVLAAATEHAVTISPLLGRWQQIRRELEQASSLDALLAVDTSLSRPD